MCHAGSSAGGPGQGGVLACPEFGAPQQGAAHIMIIDDEPINCKALRKHLAVAGYANFTLLSDAAEAPDLISRIQPDVILLDVVMPGMSGLEILGHLRIRPQFAHTPVLILTASTDAETKRKALDLGATDFLPKPPDPHELVARVRNAFLIRAHHLHLSNYAKRLEAEVEATTRELRKSNDSLLHEIGERRKAEDRLRHDAFHDTLTGLANRALLLERMARCAERSKRRRDYLFAVLFLDLDDFKIVNDSYGHRVGDRLLVEAARRIRGSLRFLDTTARPADDTTARIGGDEFVVLLDGIHRLSDASHVAERIQEALSTPIIVHGHEIVVGTSIGIATSEDKYEDPGEMLRDADTALYEAKSKGRGRFQVFGVEMRSRVLARVGLERDLRTAVENRQLRLQYQPIVSLATGEIDGFEALLRWKHPERGAISPSDFIPLAEETGLIGAIGEWTLQEACHQLQAWRLHAREHPDLSISVNLSVKQLSRGPKSLVEQVDRILEESQLDPGSLILEITETAVMEEPEAAEGMLAGLKERRVRIYLDDFGTGYSSLSQLHGLPIDGIKLDRLFVQDMGEDGQHASTIQAVVMLAKNRGFRVIAEGVEEFEQLVQLQALDCDLAQGYYFSRAVDAAAAGRLLESAGDWRKLPGAA